MRETKQSTSNFDRLTKSLINEPRKRLGFVKEFKEFAMKGNVIDMAVGVIIGGAFGKIISSFVADILMPPLGLLVGHTDFSAYSVTLKDAVIDPLGKVVSPAVMLNYGKFIQASFDFTLMAFAIFIMIKLINRLKRSDEAVVEAKPNKQEELLTEIRDLLKEQQNKR